MAAHQVNEVEILGCRRLQGLVDEREQCLIVDAAVLMRLAQAREAAVITAARKKLRDIAPDARTLLIREPVRPVARRLHRVDHVVVGVPRFRGIHVCKRQELAEHGDRRRLRRDGVAEDGEVPLHVQFVEIWCILQRIAVKVHAVARRRLTEDEDDVRRIAVVLRNIDIRYGLLLELLKRADILDRRRRRSPDAHDRHVERIIDDERVVARQQDATRSQ